MCQELQIFASCMYVLGCKLSLVRLCESDFGITLRWHCYRDHLCCPLLIIIIDYEAVFPELSITHHCIQWNQTPKCLLRPVICKSESVEKLSMETVAVDWISDNHFEISAGICDWKKLQSVWPITLEFWTLYVSNTESNVKHTIPTSFVM